MGHLGSEKTKDRLLRNYYWPGIFRDVARYCASCTECQKTAKRQSKNKAELIPMPVIEEPFRRIAMDMVGPLPRTKAGNRYVLVVCDYATRYPEAIPVKSMEADVIADELVAIFSRMGLPDEILSDQGTNFTSKLMRNVCELLKIHKLQTSPYHPQCNGLVERFNGTLKAMLRKFCADDPENWDRYLPYLLFAYREVPNSSTGFSPFELLYGHHVRGPLDVLSETWTGEVPDACSVIEHVMRMRQRLSTMSQLARESLEESQDIQKTWYDQKARERSFEVGQKVLVLLPAATNKLQAQWQGPFKVVRKVTPVNYEVETGSIRKKFKTFHINMLRLWVDREESVLSVKTIGPLIQEGEGIAEISPSPTQTESVKDIAINPELSPDQRKEIDSILMEYADIFTDLPGRTNLVEHHIQTTTEIPIHQRPYRLPEAMKAVVRQELDKMLAQGVIEPSLSP